MVASTVVQSHANPNTDPKSGGDAITNADTKPDNRGTEHQPHTVYKPLGVPDSVPDPTDVSRAVSVPHSATYSHLIGDAYCITHGYAHPYEFCNTYTPTHPIRRTDTEHDTVTN